MLSLFRCLSFHFHFHIVYENIKFIAWLIISTLNIISVLCACVCVCACGSLYIFNLNRMFVVGYSVCLSCVTTTYMQSSPPYNAHIQYNCWHIIWNNGTHLNVLACIRMFCFAQIGTNILFLLAYYLLSSILARIILLLSSCVKWRYDAGSSNEPSYTLVWWILFPFFFPNYPCCFFVYIGKLGGVMALFKPKSAIVSSSLPYFLLKCDWQAGYKSNASYKIRRKWRFTAFPCRKILAD